MTKRSNLSTADALCIRQCGRSALPDRRRCAVCLEKQRAENRRFYKDRVQKGQCPHCTSAASVGIFCLTHWFKNVGVPHGLGSKKGIELLQALWEEQKGCCAVTGEKLVPGVTASIDHIIPKSRGGTSERHNLRWVLLSINRCKWDMTHDEFLETCRKVVRAQTKHDEFKASATLRSN